MTVDKAAFLDKHVYSDAPEASWKFRIDQGIMGGDFSKADMIDMHDESYLSQLIEQASVGTTKVSTNAKGLQFFIINGGAEGFLDPSYRGQDASHLLETFATTSGLTGTMIFDDNDLLAVFDKQGRLINSALLRRPFSIVTSKEPHKLTADTANRVYDAWDGQPVNLYFNDFVPGWIKYFGLWVRDKLGWYVKNVIRIDLHKEEATNGCIFIVDPNNPGMNDKAKLDAFEPQLIKDVQKAINAKTANNIGTMRMIDVATRGMIP
jgi:hypothetical protein